MRNARRAAGFGRNGADEIATAALSALAFALYVQGELPEARAVAQEALDRPDSTERPHGPAYALSTLALLELERERPHAAEAYARRALDITAAAGLSASWTAGLAHTARSARRSCR